MKEGTMVMYSAHGRQQIVSRHSHMARAEEDGT